MPRYQKPESDSKRLSMAEQALERLKQNDGAVAEATAVSLQTAYDEFKKAHQSVQSLTNVRQAEVEEAEEAMAQVQMFIRHIWSLIKNRVDREQLPAHVYGFYGLSLAGDLPLPSGRDEWVQMANTIIDGEKQAIERGYKPVPEPTIAKLTAVLQNAQTNVYEVNTAHDNVRKALQTLVEAREPLDRALEDLVADIQHSLRREPAPVVRNVIRSYGGNYRYAEGEPIEDTDTLPKDTNSR